MGSGSCGTLRRRSPRPSGFTDELDHAARVNRVGGGLAAPVLPHHRTYSAYPAVSSTVSTGTTTRQGSFPFRHRGRWLLLAHPSSGSAFTRDAGAHGLLPPFKKGELLGRALLPLYAHRVLLTGSLQ